MEERSRKFWSLAAQAFARSGYNPRRDRVFWNLLLSNILSMVLAWYQHWNIGEVMWTYWCQSVSIGIGNYIRMRTVKNFTTNGIRLNGQPLPDTIEGQRKLATFFAMHYGVFHLGYAVFLWMKQPPMQIVPPVAVGMLVSILGFAFTHIFRLYDAALTTAQAKPNLASLMMFPYLRILPMHLTIILGSLLGNAALFIFMPLKTIVDLGMHVVEKTVPGVADE